MFTLQKNSGISNVPGSAESAQTEERYQEFPGRKHLSAVVVYHRDSQLTEADRKTVDDDRAVLARKLPKGEVPAAEFSRDGTTAHVDVGIPVRGNDLSFDETEKVTDAVDAVERTVRAGEARGGLETAVTGQAAYTSASAGVMGDANVPLFLAVLLLLVLLLACAFRGAVLWGVVLACGGFGMAVAEGVVYLLGKAAGLTYTTLSQGLLTVLALGAAVHYGLLVTARYREGLRAYEDKHAAMAHALRRAGPTALAAAGAVVVTLLCLTAADVTSTQALGPVCAVAVLCAVAVATTLLPPVLLVFGRWLLWPDVPRPAADAPSVNGLSADGPSADGPSAEGGASPRAAGLLRRRPRAVWAGCAALLGALALGLFATSTGLAADEGFSSEPQAVAGQRLLAGHAPGGTGHPVTVVTASAAADRTLAAVRDTEGVTGARKVAEHEGRALLTATPTAAPGSAAALDGVERLRDAVHAVKGARAVVGGADAVALDTREAAARDRALVAPLVLLALAVCLGLLLRAVLAALLLTGAVALTWAATLGLVTAASGPVLGFEGQDPTLALHSLLYVAVLAAGSTVFLMSRIRTEHAESAESGGSGSGLGSPEAVLRGLAATSRVTFWAGLVLAGVFGALGLIPSVPVTQTALVVALGMLLDVCLVRPLLVPALLLDAGERSWWPGGTPERTERNRVSGIPRPRSPEPAETMSGDLDV
ncbi:MMPL family transporter [Streptomyces albiaxialis]